MVSQPLARKHSPIICLYQYWMRGRGMLLFIADGTMLVRSSTSGQLMTLPVFRWLRRPSATPLAMVVALLIASGW